ncbi:MAG TPA: hypothetical protein VFD30_03980 [Terriglobia bacterium]|jgi:hypothetical protein|nr:hypothetical protein [Terriglobia bacterium]
MKKVLILLFASVPMLLILSLATLNPPSVRAVPSYARQTGLPCSGCHYTPPELNPAGRKFKLLGYVDRDKEKAKTDVTDEAKKHHAGLDLLASLPLSAMFDTSFTSTKTPQPGTQNGNFEFPQDVSVFLAGAWTTHVGSFLQVTYDAQADKFSMDNTDIRYANKRNIGGKELDYGVTLNNNPTVEDLWNSTPAWGFPWIASDSAPTPTAAPIIAGGLAQDVAGLGGYAMWDNHLYAVGTVYRSNHLGNPQPNSGMGYPYNIRGVAPYWRVAWQQLTPKTQYEFGTYGMHMDSTPNAVVGLKDTYTDWAVDFQVDRTVFRRDVLSLRGTYIGENSTLAATFAAGGAQVTSHNLKTLLANAEYHFGNRFSGTFGWFDTEGTPDPLLYAQSEVTGSANGDPRGAGYILSFSLWPMQNLQLAVQYTGYTRFNGAAINYDGMGRNASGNNAVYLLGRFIF